jgi:hypothetical protein
MMKSIVLSLLLFPALNCTAASYTQAVVSEDGKKLSFVADGVKLDAPLAVSEQEAFDKPQISADGHTIGWLALTPNCCTSYPLPTGLVLFSNGRIIQDFAEAPPIWRWAFVHNAAEVAYAKHPPHGRFVVEYKLRRVSDGKLVDRYTCDQDDETQMSGKHAPAWVLTVAFTCPEVAQTP